MQETPVSVYNLKDAVQIKLRKAIHLNGITYPLFLTVQRSQENGAYHAYVAIPADYPRTAFVKLLLDNEEGQFAYLYVYFLIRTAEEAISSFCINKSYFPWLDDPEAIIGHLGAFYVTMNSKPEYREAALPEEQQAMHGLGKAMLCVTVKFAYNQGIFQNLQHSYLTAEADGGNPKPQRISQLQLNSEDELLLYLVKTYPHAAIRWIQENAQYGDAEALPSYISRVEENGKLIEYYKREYGFSLLQSSYSPAALIGVKVTTLIDKCGSK